MLRAFYISRREEAPPIGRPDRAAGGRPCEPFGFEVCSVNPAIRLVLASALTLMLAVQATPMALAAPITFNTALPVGKGGLIFRQQLIIAQFSSDPDAMARDTRVIQGVSILGYGVTNRLAIFAVLPVVHRSRQIGASEGSITGLGDATVFARQRLITRDRPGQTLRLASFAGLTLPTGRTGRTSDGSTDAFAGAILTAATTNWAFGAQLQYVVNTEANGFEQGDTASADLSLQYRLIPRRISTARKGFLFGVLEANITHRGQTRVAALPDPNSGGVQLSVSPGIQYATRRWIAETAITIPIATTQNTNPGTPSYSLITSLRINF